MNNVIQCLMINRHKWNYEFSSISYPVSMCKRCLRMRRTPCLRRLRLWRAWRRFRLRSIDTCWIRPDRKQRRIPKDPSLIRLGHHQPVRRYRHRLRAQPWNYNISWSKLWSHTGPFYFIAWAKKTYVPNKVVHLVHLVPVRMGFHFLFCSKQASH